VRLPDADADGSCQHWDVLRMVLEDADKELTRRDILDEWPEDFDKPNSGTLSRWLTRAIKTGLIESAGTGRRSDPFRYWLPGAEERWRAENPLYDLDKRREKDLRRLLPGLRTGKPRSARGD
jgi:hypothetical protein